MTRHVLAMLIIVASPAIALALQPGADPPGVEATNQDGKTVNLADLYGRRPVVIFFYPKSFTPGCTIEVQSFRDTHDDLSAFDAAVFGVSQDDQSTQRKFCDQYELQYDLLVDDGAIAKAFDVPAKGRFNSRWTVVIGRTGKVLLVEQNVNQDIKAHPANVRSALQADWKQYLAGFEPLFNGKDLDDWVPIQASADTWTVADGVLRCSGNPVCYVRTKKSYADYKLLVEFKYTEKLGNAGLLVHITGPDQVWPKSIEPNLNVGQMGKFYVIDGAEVKYVGENPLQNVEIAPGQWHRYEITCKADTIEAVLNGRLVNRAVKSNLTAGLIGIQSEGVPVHFRTVAIKSLK